MPGTEARLPHSVDVFAPAKINLTLHVVGQRADGYHLLDSLVAFATVGDQLGVQMDNGFSLKMQGSEAATLPEDASNLILQVADLFDHLPGAAFHLTKELPVSSGIGGGSADAAAAYRALSAVAREADIQIPTPETLLKLGADVPMCLTSRAARIGGIGEQITPVALLPALPAVLVNPRREVATPAVFKAMTTRQNAPMPRDLPTFNGTRDLANWLRGQRNDLEPAASQLEPMIDVVKAAISTQPDCLLSRMSGSGATCFGLFPTLAAAQKAAAAIARHQPEWWVKPTELGSQNERAQPRLS
ncbi:4-(cytidine 5'-diphospho)-2-C-methyl-D-erythritol kinase [Roseobacter sp. MH60115]|uniref:4-(cytidine 5'-diphospho)-2-C-methyl-D-erythritol kinase n=1 Tax=Roseobacter sp. MH60115 TaxID=2785324 RepID=UPI001E333CF5|nr:4-(cytidine 5'-diphospho)-2-C-methyl-D-erythritol kinase [Roseobacter sp. MH60115]